MIIIKKIAFITLLGLLVFCFFIWPVVVSYNQNKYDQSYNEKRMVFGIPIIPLNWKIKTRDKNGIYWCGDEKVLGHKRKFVAFDGRSIILELDVYNLKPQNGKQRLLEMEFNYPSKTSKMYYVYTYQNGEAADTITKIIADSILTAEKIKKD